jgi:CHAT domain-containing protein/predicted negative regulator of RcsB-dependent stress response
MLNPCANTRLPIAGLLLLMAGYLVLPLALTGQTAPSPTEQAPGAPLPGGVQAQLDRLTDALKAARAANDAKAEASTLNQIGRLHYQTSDFQKALDDFSHALAIQRELGNSAGAAAALQSIGDTYDALADKRKALDSYNQAAATFHQLKNPAGEARMLVNIGFEYMNLGDKQKALDSYNQALPILRQAGDRDAEARALMNIGAVNSVLGEQQKALDFYNQALPLFRQVGDRSGEAATIHRVGTVYRELGEQQKALDSYNQALAIRRAMGDHAGLPSELTGIGTVYSLLGEKQKALDYFIEALSARRALGDRPGEGVTLNNIGLVYKDLGDQQKALECFNQVLAIFRNLGDRSKEAAAQINIGAAYDDLGDYREALEHYMGALEVVRSLRDRVAEGEALANIGAAYADLGEPQKALDYLNQALLLERAVGDRVSEGTNLTDLGHIYADFGEKQKALGFYSQALQIQRAVGDRAGEASTLDRMGMEYDKTGEPEKALEFYKQALPLATEVSDPLREALIFTNLMRNQRASQPVLAVFYGKQAINRLQQVRSNIQGLDEKLQKSFLVSKNDYYRTLADLLVAQGRLSEAEQVLNLEKQQEYSDFVRGEAANTLGPLAMTPAEQQAQEEYQKSTATLVSLGEQWAQLRKNTARTPEQEKQFQELSAQLNQASNGLAAFYSRLYDLFGKVSSANNQVRDVKGPVSDLKRIIAKMPHTVAMYTLVGRDRTSIIVIAGAADVPAVVRECAIPEVELNKKVAAFQQVLRQPGQDPRPLAQELYKILILPVKADLDQAKAETLVWSLDGVLRYVPIAALYDGKHYVVESYNTATISPTSIVNLAQPPDRGNLSTVAMGISQKYEEQLPALPAVESELDEVVKNARVPGANGALAGTILLNGQFTEKAMENQLGGQPAVVHIASHFVYSPAGDAGKSYLLLAGKDHGGEAFHLTVKDFRDDVNLSLSETALLTLSACETGMSGSESDGREVDGLGMTAEYKGAKAVISTLWSVNDVSTGKLMGDFYKRWADGAGRVTKVEALRQAQLDLLLGKATVTGNGNDRGVALSKTEAPAVARYSHPYYWAPFVLMGNWR